MSHGSSPAYQFAATGRVRSARPAASASHAAAARREQPLVAAPTTQSAQPRSSGSHPAACVASSSTAAPAPRPRPAAPGGRRSAVGGLHDADRDEVVAPTRRATSSSGATSVTVTPRLLAANGKVTLVNSPRTVTTRVPSGSAGRDVAASCETVAPIATARGHADQPGPPGPRRVPRRVEVRPVRARVRHRSTDSATARPADAGGMPMGACSGIRPGRRTARRRHAHSPDTTVGPCIPTRSRSAPATARRCGT